MPLGGWVREKKLFQLHKVTRDLADFGFKKMEEGVHLKKHTFYQKFHFLLVALSYYKTQQVHTSCILVLKIVNTGSNQLLFSRIFQFWKVNFMVVFVKVAATFCQKLEERKSKLRPIDSFLSTPHAYYVLKKHLSNDIDQVYKLTLLLPPMSTFAEMSKIKIKKSQSKNHHNFDQNNRNLLPNIQMF